MRKLLALFLALLLSLAICQAHAEGSEQNTYTIANLLEYTVYDPGDHSSSSSVKQTQYFYPDAGGMLMVQVADFDRVGWGYNEEMIYSILFPGFISAVEDTAENTSLYYQKRFMCNGYFGLHTKMTHTVSEQSVNDNCYYILLPNQVVSLHFVDTLKLGAYPQESIPYILASLHFLD